MDIKDYAKKQEEGKKRLKEILGPKVKLPFMLWEDKKTTFTLYPCSWILKIKRYTVYVQQFPLKLGYALSLQDFESEPINLHPFTRMSTLDNELEKDCFYYMIY